MDRKTFVLSAVAVLMAVPAFALLSVEPSVADAPWTQGFWLARFDKKRALAKEGGYDVVFLGDSITHLWETTGSNVWSKTFAEGPCRALNCGFSGDRTVRASLRSGSAVSRFSTVPMAATRRRMRSGTSVTAACWTASARGSCR